MLNAIKKIKEALIKIDRRYKEARLGFAPSFFLAACVFIIFVQLLPFSSWPSIIRKRIKKNATTAEVNQVIANNSLQTKIIAPAIATVTLPTTTASATAPIVSLIPTIPSSSIVIDAAVLASPQNYVGLPLRSVKLEAVTSSWGTALLIPQTHRYPGSAAADTANNSAEIVQNQIYKVVQYVHSHFNVNFVMAEGDLYGEVPASKIAALARRIDNEKRFSEQAGKLENAIRNISNVPPSLVTTISGAIEQIKAKYTREIILEGAPYKLKAEGVDFTLYGSENQTTLDEGTVLVRNYIFLQDRLQQLTTAPQTPSAGLSILPALPQSLDIKSYISMLQTQPGPEQTLQLALSNAVAMASARGDKEILKAVQDLQKTLGELTRPEAPLPAINAAALKNAPIRADNPYRTITEEKVIQSKLMTVEKEINVTVVEKRNKEAAAHFAQALREQANPVGIIQYGAGHEAGLVKELQAQGLSVVVLTPLDVAV